ncbi:MAG: DNA primase noncatalytic subunit PriX [Desulfurococcales archaeon]|nr:DNA primase noncatalytic subunit PriX [Desulfurococcales archaeon]
MTPRSVKLQSSMADSRRDLTDPGSLEEFYRKWLATHLGLNWFVEIAHSGPDNREFTRNLFHLPETGAGLILGVRRERNVMASSARFPEPVADRSQARYPVLTLDFDCEEDPWSAVGEALRIARALKQDYGADSVIVRSGYKGAHLHIPLKSLATHEELRVIGERVIEMFKPRGCRGKPIVDTSSFSDYRHLIRVPHTFNIRGRGRRLALLLDYRLNRVDPRDFEWGEPLDPRSLGIVLVRVVIPLIKRPHARRSRPKWGWIEKILENGLPDGRKRFILYVASRYLVNVKGLGIEEALEELQQFLDASCERHSNCSRIYTSWLRSVLRAVREKRLYPPGLSRLREKDPELYTLINTMVSTHTVTRRLVKLPEPVRSFLEETGQETFTYQDLKEWLETKKGKVTSEEWSRYTRLLRKLAEEGLLGRMFLVEGKWKDYGPGPVEKPPSRKVKFYVVGEKNTVA